MHRTQLQCEAISLRQTLPKARFLTGDDIVANSCASEIKAGVLSRFAKRQPMQPLYEGVDLCGMFGAGCGFPQALTQVLELAKNDAF